MTNDRTPMAKDPPASAAPDEIHTTSRGAAKRARPDSQRTVSHPLTDLLKALWYSLLQLLAKGLCVLLFKIRVTGRHHVPPHGGALLVANHQSYLDPVLVGVALRRRVSYVARVELFGFAPFRWLIESLDAIPIRASKIGLGGIRESLHRLRQGRLVLIFPEGGRTPDGTLQRLRPGFCTLATRADVPVIPVGIQGAYEAWSRHRRFLRPHRIAVHFGPPLPADAIRGLSEEDAVELVYHHIAEACEQAARFLVNE
jgi:1-acyl-sn-glycerol-3-phosphate acyltransferase